MPEPRIHDLLESSVFPLRLRPTARETLKEFIDIDVTTDDLVRILNNNPAYRDMFERFVRKKTKGQQAPKEGEDKDAEPEEIPTHRLIGLLGMISSRDFILTLRMIRSVTGNFPVAADGTLDVKTTDYLKRCTEIDELFQRNKYNYAEAAYSAGYLYDWILYLAKQQKEFKKFEEYLNQNWKVAVRAGLAAHHLAERVGGFQFLKFAFSGGACCFAGKALMALLFQGDEHTPSWLDFCGKTASIEMNYPTAHRVMEEATFGMTHEEAASAALHAFDVFKPFSLSIRYYREPYYLVGRDKAQHQFALLLNIACSMGKTWKMLDEKDPLFVEWMKSAVKLRLNNKQVLDALKAAMSTK